MLHSVCWGQAALIPAVAPADEVEAVFTVQAEDQHAVVRLLTRAPACPEIEWDGKTLQPMAVRASAATVAVRGGGAQEDSKAAVFDVLTCEAAWPAGVARARVAGRDVPAPGADIRRIVLIADTGCRMKGSENAFQPCNDPLKWPFAQVAKNAAATKPDLVIHIGDIHYRESPCPPGNEACANAPWGYGYDAWQADFFGPAKPLLVAAPWVFVRGNHETCARAGQGWFRFIDAQPWLAMRSCNDAAFDEDADHSQPYAVSLSADTQLLVFDSSKTNGKPFKTTDRAFDQYTQELKTVDQLAQQKPNSFFMSHHPLLAVAPGKNGSNFKLAGNEGLQSVFGVMYPERLFPDGVSVALHGHVHFFESISFKSKHPVSLVLGNAGSANEGAIPQKLPPGALLYAGAEVEDYAATADFGFATMDRVDAPVKGGWLLTEYTTLGQPVFQCAISGGKSRCSKVGALAK
jgi:hypothetical protein